MAHKGQFTTAFFLDTRTVKKTGKYPVKIRIYDKTSQAQKLYATRFDMTEAEFTSVWQTIKPRSEHKPLRREMEKTLHEFNEAAESLTDFSFPALERIVLKRSRNEMDDVKAMYTELIKSMEENGRIGTARSYQCSINSLMDFHNKPTLRFTDITPKWLETYEKAMQQKGKSQSTVGIYLRPLRAVFNQALADEVITQKQYPFGLRRYVIPAPKAVKKALSGKQMKHLSEATPQTPEQEKARDFWFLSYDCYGANMKDILNLKWANFDGEAITFNRQKTIRTKKDAKPIVVFINDRAKSIIEKYANTDRTGKAFIFPILSASDTPQEAFRKVQNFTRFINQNFLKLAKSAGINEPISTYWARHTFATTAIRKGASREFVGDALGHSDTKTTNNYFAGYDRETQKEFAQSLMEF